MRGLSCPWYWISFSTQKRTMTPVVLTNFDPPARYLARFGKSPSNRYATGLFSILAHIEDDIVLIKRE